MKFFKKKKRSEQQPNQATQKAERLYQESFDNLPEVNLTSWHREKK